MLILIGLVLQFVEVIIFLGIGVFLLTIPIFGAIVLGLAVIGVLWIALVYLLSYKPASDGNYVGARTPTLVFGILSLLTAGIISGILYIVAYAKLGDAERDSSKLRPWGGGPPPSPGSRFCPACGRPSPPLGRFCEGCGSRLG
jgi:hypothetical protein